MDAATLEAKLARAYFEGDDEPYTDNELWSELPYCKDVLSAANAELVANVGGEGQGETRYLVLKVTNEDGSEQYFRKDGWYQSYYGSEWDGDFYEVVPEVRPVTYYERKK